MKKISLHIFIIICALAVLFPVSTLAAKQVVVEPTTLNVRDGQSTDHAMLGTIYQGEQYDVIQETDEWVEIDWNGQTGWVSKEYVHIIEAGADTNERADETDESNQSFKTEIDQLYLRSEATTASSIAAFLDKGTECTVMDDASDQWYHVTCGEQQGYMFKSHVTDSPQVEHESLRGKTIVIDAGHGGRDVGAISINGLYEKDLTLTTALALEKTLTILGANVYMTRDDDTYLLLESRSVFANTVYPDAFISIHYNSFPEMPSVSGIGSYYYEGLDQPLAEAIQHSVAFQSERSNRGAEFGDYQVLRLSIHPGMLAELGFISNEETESLLQTDAYQDKLVHGMVNGLSTFFAHHKK